MEEKLICSHCGNEITDDDYSMVNGQIVCSDCVERYCCTCDRCGATIFDSDTYGDEYTNLCRYCYDNYYTRCETCDALVHVDDAYHYNNSDYCSECYHDIANENSAIKEYGYKPDPIFYGESQRYFGVELEIDGAGKDSNNAREILDIGNEDGEHIYIKSDGSLDDGMEIVSHPMTLDYHKNYCWSEIMKKAVSLGYRSHQTSTCGLHIHVNRICFGESREEQDEVISRVLYFVEHHWNELLKFSRRSEYTINRWAARYGYENSPKAIMDKAKKGNFGRYAAVNLCNYSTIEFRLFRGTLKLNTFIATLQLVNEICNVAVYISDEGLQKLSCQNSCQTSKIPSLSSISRNAIYTSTKWLKKRRNINMCALFGWLDYKGIIPKKLLKKLTQALANAAEERGTDAAGISYIKDGKVTIYKRPRAAHLIRFNAPDDTKAIMGHTRMATQGDKRHNYNNHPFSCIAGDTAFAFAHNGVLWNDKDLRKKGLVPESHIETDSYVACQLIEQQGKLDFDSLKYMAETVEGNFTFTALDQHNSLYIVKGSNPMCLLHFEALGIYIYASTESIMKNALKKVGFHKFDAEKVEVFEGDILKIDETGTMSRAEFEYLSATSHFGWYNSADYYPIHEELLLAYCGCYGVDSADVELLLDYGYTPDEVEDMLVDTDLLHETLRAIRFEECESVYEGYSCAF